MSEAEPISNARLYKVKGRGHSPLNSRLRKRNTIPKGESFIWETAEMLESPALRVMPFIARQVVDRIKVEHCAHGGTENGRLPVTYSDFEKYGACRHSIRTGILIAEALGWIDIVESGHRGAADVRRAARYGLTWLDRYDGAPRTNRWKRFETMEQARAAVAEVKAQIKAVKAAAKKAKAKEAGARAAKPVLKIAAAA